MATTTMVEDDGDTAVVRELEHEVPPPGSVAELAEEYGFGNDALARLLGMSVRSVSGLRNERHEMSDVHRRKVVELCRLVELLAAVMDAGYIATWMETAVPALNDFKPIELIERGEIVRILDLINRLRSGSPM